MRAPLSIGLVGRFLVSGGVVFVVNVGLMALLSGPVGVPIQPAIALAFVGAAVVHFALNSTVVFDGPAGYHHGLRTQVWRYLGLTSISYGGTALGTAMLPHVLPLSTYGAYLVSMTGMAAVVFVCLRVLVFAWRSDGDHARDAERRKASVSASDSGVPIS